MPVGNDVVDLRDPANRPDVLHPRFDRRVFSDADLARLAACPDEEARHRLRWALWAARESAFKYLRQLGPDAVFRPRSMIVSPDDEQGWAAAARDASAGRRLTGRVLVDGDGPARDWLRLSLDADGERVHAVVHAGGSESVTEGLWLEGPAPAPAVASAGVRELAARTVERVLGLPPDEVRVVAPGSAGGAPRAVRGGLRLPVDLSLSHDGRWLACVVLRR